MHSIEAVIASMTVALVLISSATEAAPANPSQSEGQSEGTCCTYNTDGECSVIESNNHMTAEQCCNSFGDAWGIGNTYTACRDIIDEPAYSDPSPSEDQYMGKCWFDNGECSGSARDGMTAIECCDTIGESWSDEEICMNCKDIIDEETIVCPYNQEFYDCEMGLPQICGELPPMFFDECVTGCGCPLRWWKKEDGSCVENESECDKHACPHNQVIFNFENRCQNDCGELPAMMCETYATGCGCPSGWWKKEDGSCVESESECDKHVCPQNQVIYNFETRCANICGERPAMMCETYFIGCGCPTGWWQKEDGSCVESESECDKHYQPIQCPHSDQQFSWCGPGCPSICGEDDFWWCPHKCKMGCFCPYGWWKQEDGSCVETEAECDIDRSCPHNQVWTTCRHCDYYCDGTASCISDCPSGCECPSHLPYQTDEGVCVAQCSV